MSDRIDRVYDPDYATPPGATVQETLDSLGLSQAELAERTGRPKKTVNEIIKGKAAITPETALQLERVLGVPASFWNNLERNYRAVLARQEERSHLARHVEWLESFPLRTMIRRGWVRPSPDKLQQLRELLNFFGVVSPEVWSQLWSPQVATYRRTAAFESNFKAIAAWLRQGELESQQISCRTFNTTQFRKALTAIRALTIQLPQVFEPLMVELCANAGVAVVFIKEFPKTGTYGATRWLSPKKALMQLSLRYKFNDQFWFTFFHEAAHILLHGKRRLFVEADFIDDENEQEANRFAADFLIPRGEFDRFVRGGEFDRDQVLALARRLGIAPGIVVGRLQKEGMLTYSKLNSLKLRYDIIEEG